MGNILVGQSGGPTAAINASLAGVINGGYNSDRIEKVYGTRYGISGILSDNIIDMKLFKDDKMLKILMQTPSAYLGSCRKKLPDQFDETYEKIFSIFKKYNIEYFFYIGGNDSMDTVNKLSKYAEEKNITDIKIIGIPKTIDNDLMGTDHTPGFGSAAKFVANSIKQIAHDNKVYDMDSITIVEIMGRNAGWLTASSALANDSENTYADMICLPEVPFETNKVLDKIKELVSKKKGVVIALSEGVCDKEGRFFCECGSDVFESSDIFNHKQLGGAGKCLEKLIREKLGIKVRSIELSTMQRCFSAMASKDDILSAFIIGNEGVMSALKGLTGVMMGYKRISDEPYEYEIIAIDSNDVANFEKKVPKSMISEDGFGVTDEFIKYAKPLVDGDYEISFKDGIIETVVL